MFKQLIILITRRPFDVQFVLGCSGIKNLCDKKRTDGEEEQHSWNANKQRML